MKTKPIFNLVRAAALLVLLSILNSQLSTAVAAPTVAHVAAGYYHTLFIGSDGSLWAMGANGNGELGDGTTTDQHTPEMILPNNVVAVAGGWFHSVLVKSDGNLWGMGGNNNGQLGDGGNTDQHSPEQIIFNGGVTAVAAGGYQSLFLKTNDVLWGMGAGGTLGNGNSCDIHGPIQLAGNVTTMAAGDGNTYFVDNNGSIWATGFNYNGQVGDGTTTYRNYFVEIFTNKSVFSGGLAVSGNFTHACYSYLAPGAVISLWGWGDNYNGDIGDCTTTERNSPVEALSSGVAAIAAGGYHTLVLKNDGSLWAMGDNSYGQLGDGTTTPHYCPEMIVSANVTAIAAGAYHSVFIKSDGSLWAMGDNSNGQLGDGSTVNSYVPERIFPPAQLIINKMNLSGTNLVLSGNNQFSGGFAVVLSSTNPATPLSQWTHVWTNGIANGNFTLTATNAVNPGFPWQFYALQLFQIE